MLTSGEKIFLANSAEFQKILAEDIVLKELAGTEYSKTNELQSFFELAGSSLQIGPLKIRPLTAGLWSFLWYLDNNYTSDVKQITEVDTDIFLYLLCQDRLDFSTTELKDLLYRSLKWCQKFHIDYSEAAAFLLQLVNRSFSPLSLLPEQNFKKDAPEWDCLWLTQYGCTVSGESGQSIEYCMFEMPLQLGFYCMINAFRKNDIKGLIHKRTAKEKAEEIGNYVEKLGEEFISRVGKITSR